MSRIQQNEKINYLGNVIAKQTDDKLQLYLGSPSIAMLSNGHYVVSHDFFGKDSSEHEQGQTHIYLSKDKGTTWQLQAKIVGAFWSSLFLHQDKLYLLGTNKNLGSVVIRKSLDGGKTWTKPTDRNNGLLLNGEYHCAPTPVLYHNGRIWRAIETANGPIREWGKRYGAMVIAALEDADLLKADSWTSSNFLLYNTAYLNGNFNGWLEGNIVLAPGGGLQNVLRVDDKSSLEEKVAVLDVSDEGRRIEFDAENGFRSFPGGSKKFTIRFDPLSSQYWSLANIIPDEIKDRHQGENPSLLRNTLALISSTDLVEWETRKVVLQHPNTRCYGFQYADWIIDGQDIVFVSRTAIHERTDTDRKSGLSKLITFHKLMDFRNICVSLKL